MWRKYPDAGTGVNARVQGLEKIKGNIYWLSQNLDTLQAWLKKNTMQWRMKEKEKGKKMLEGDENGRWIVGLLLFKDSGHT